jgi:3-hydroxyisobutyrate dehydrogenase
MSPDLWFDLDLKKINTYCWQLLRDGVTSYKKPFHFGVFITMSDIFPEARTVIVRSVDEEKKIIRFNTDIRSPKVRQLQENPNVSWLFYDSSLRIQLRCKAFASVHTGDEIADEGWRQARLNCKLTYTSPNTPGVILDEPFLLDLNRTDVSEFELNEARKNFSIVQTRVVSMDWAFLHYQGNRRAFFDYQNHHESWIQT